MLLQGRGHHDVSEALTSRRAAGRVGGYGASRAPHDGLDNDPDGFADDCDSNWVAHPDCGRSDAAQCGDVGPYPFAGVGSTYGDEAYPNADYVNRVWSAVDAERDALGPMAQPLTFAVAIAGYADTRSSGEAFEGVAYTDFVDPETARVGASVVAMPRLLDPDDEALAQELFGFAIAHEIGHSLGLAHDDTDWDGARGFMHSNGGTAPILDWDADSLVSDPSGILTLGEVWRDQAGGKEWPRSPGFGYRGCTTSPDNCAGALTCNPLLGETDYDGAGGSPPVTGTCQ